MARCDGGGSLSIVQCAFFRIKFLPRLFSCHFTSAPFSYVPTILSSSLAGMLIARLSGKSYMEIAAFGLAIFDTLL